MSFNFTTCRRVPPRNFFPNPPNDGSKRPWSRATGFQCLDGFTDEQLDMRRKAEILKYKNNNANLSKRQLYSRRARAIGVEQKTWATQPFISGNTTVTFDNKSINSNTNPNIRNLKGIENILICPSKKNPICNPSSNSDVPGNKDLCYDKTVPLVGYKERIGYSKIGTTWPQRSWEPGDNGFPVGKIGSGNIYTNNINNVNPNNSNNTNPNNNNSSRNLKKQEINEEKTNNNILSIISKNNLFDYDDFFYYPEEY